MKIEGVPNIKCWYLTIFKDGIDFTYNSTKYSHSLCISIDKQVKFFKDIPYSCTYTPIRKQLSDYKTRKLLKSIKDKIKYFN